MVYQSRCRLLEARAKANKLKKNIEVANQDQVSLANMQTQFVALDSELSSVVRLSYSPTHGHWAYVCHDLLLSIVSSSEKVHMNGQFICSILSPSSWQT